MAFFRCMPPASSGGGGGDSSYGVQIDYGNGEYLNFQYLYFARLPIYGSTFNSPVKIAKDVISLNGIVMGCAGLNSPVTFDTPEDDYNYYQNMYNDIATKTGVALTAGGMAVIGDGSGMFTGCSVFNQPISLDNRFRNMAYMFNNCQAFNQPVKIPKSAITVSAMFYNCIVFNSIVDFSECDSRNGGQLNYMSAMFSNCQNFNQPVNLPLIPSYDYAPSPGGSGNVAAYQSIFYNCTNFNSKFSLKVKNMFTGNFSGFMKNCTNYNIPLYIDGSESDRLFLDDAFTYMCNFRQPMLIEFNPGGPTFTARNMFNRLTTSTPMNHNRPTDLIFHNLNSNLTVSSAGSWTRNMLIGCSERTNQRINIYIPVLEYLTYMNNALGIIGKAVTWTSMTNGLYNATYNVYLYNNVQDGVNQFWDYYNNFYNIS